jgi:hypothetical protein
VDVVASLVADQQPAAAGDPGQRALDYPAVAAQPLAALDPAPGDPGDDAALPAGAAAAGVVVGCHSADYITTQPRNVANPHAFWAAEVTKMQHVYGAPIDNETAQKIVDYLATAYGRP